MRVYVFVFALILLVLPGAVLAHEPLFGLGPHTIGQYSWAVESEFARNQAGWLNTYELLYGLTPDIAITGVFPYVFARDGRAPGFGDLVLRGKYRFVRQDFRGGSRAFALHLGVKFPTGNQQALRGTGAFDAFAGLSFGLESRRHYAFAGARYLLRGTSNNLQRGNVFRLEAAYGIRPWKLEYLQPDLVLLAEVLAETAGKNRIDNTADPNSGGFTLSVAPGALFSYRNVMFKAGVKIPMLNRLNGIQENPGAELILAVELHMPPFK